MSRSDAELAADALAHLRMMRSHLQQEELDNATVADAVALRLAAAIEAIAAASPALRSRLFGEDWALAWATRNRIAHGYAFIDISIIEKTVEEDVPRLEQALTAELSRIDREATE